MLPPHDRANKRLLKTALQIAETRLKTHSPLATASIRGHAGLEREPVRSGLGEEPVATPEPVKIEPVGAPLTSAIASTSHYPNRARGGDLSPHRALSEGWSWGRGGDRDQSSRSIALKLGTLLACSAPSSTSN
jgi:hypothetical protein